jgi:phosphatidylglycerophosphatase A
MKPAPADSVPPPLGGRAGVILWLAQGLGAGRLPVAPGTWGSLAGLLWTAVLLASGSAIVWLLGLLGGTLASVWLCGRAEEILRQKDPQSVVIDEIIAVPLSFAGWTALRLFGSGELPSAAYFVTDGRWAGSLLVLAAFRFFDIVKPWPVYQSQSLPSGWGVTADDVLAAVYVNLLALPLLAWRGC